MKKILLRIIFLYLLGLSFNQPNIFSNPIQTNQEARLNELIRNSNDTNVIADSYNKILDLYFKNKNFTKILGLANEYTKNYPQGQLTAKIYFYLGEITYSYKEYNKALEYYRYSLSKDLDSKLNDLICQGIAYTYWELGEKNNYIVFINKIKDEELGLLAKGILNLNMNNHKEAISIFNNFLESFPNSKYLVEVYLNKANAFYEYNQIKEAIELYRFIINNFSQHSHKEANQKARYNLAWCYLKLGDYKRSLKEFRGVLTDRHNPVIKTSAKVQIADAYQADKNYFLAAATYEDILKKYPRTIYTDYVKFNLGMCYLKNKDMNQAIASFSNLVENYPSSRFITKAKYYLALSYSYKEAYPQAKHLLENFIRDYPKDDLIYKVYYLYGKCFFNENNYELAAKMFKSVIEGIIDKEIIELAYIDLASCYLNLVQKQEALSIYKDFFKKFPNSNYSGYVALALGEIYENSQDINKAKKYYQLVLEKYPTSSWAKEAYLYLAQIYLKEDKLIIAQNYLRKIINEDSPIAIKAKLNLAKIYALNSDLKASLALYDQLIDKESDLTKMAIYEKALLLKDNEQYEDSINLLNRAIGLGIKSIEAHFALALCLEKVNKYQEAKEEYYRTAYLFNDSNYQVKSYFRIAAILEKENNLSAAKDLYQKIISLDIEESKIAKLRLSQLK